MRRWNRAKQETPTQAATRMLRETMRRVRAIPKSILTGEAAALVDDCEANLQALLAAMGDASDTYAWYSASAELEGVTVSVNRQYCHLGGGRMLPLPRYRVRDDEGETPIIGFDAARFRIAGRLAGMEGASRVIAILLSSPPFGAVSCDYLA